MKILALLFSLLLIQIKTQSCDDTCTNDACCTCRQLPNPSNGNGYLEFAAECLAPNGAHCEGVTGCRLCFKPGFGSTNLGERPICDRFSVLNDSFSCSDNDCCLSNQKPNLEDGSGYLEFDDSCSNIGAGVLCVGQTGCRKCWNVMIGSEDDSVDRPVCERFMEVQVNCSDESCCLENQKPNQDDGNNFLEFWEDCLDMDSGALNCFGSSGCRFCFNPIVGGDNVGDRPVCKRFDGLTETPGCSNEECCVNHQVPNPSTGSGYLEFDDDCKNNAGGLHCVEKTGCRLCFKPVLGMIDTENIGERPICQRFSNLSSDLICDDDNCCFDKQNPNSNDGNGFFEFNQDCKNNGGGLHCIADSGCRLCYKPVLGGKNVGDRPVCARFDPGNYTINLFCEDDNCCFDKQNPNPTNGVGYFEFDEDCKNNGGGLHCVGDSGCKLCYKPVIGGFNTGDRPICKRFSSLICSDEPCCVGLQNPNSLEGNGYLEFDENCKNDVGGLNCVNNTGCRLCHKPVIGGTNVGDRPICKRFEEISTTTECNDLNCCVNIENPNPTTGSGYLEFKADCKNNGGDHCVEKTGCSLCYRPVDGGLNDGNRPICERF